MQAIGDLILQIVLYLFILAALLPLGAKPKYTALSSLAGALASLGVCVLAGWTFVVGARDYQVSLLFATLSLHIDALAAVFLSISGIAGCAVNIYSIDYVAHNSRPRQLAALGNVFSLFLFLIFTVDNALEFIVVWEAMALATFLLINHHYENAASGKAAWVYLAAGQFGVVFLIVAFALLHAHYNSFAFADFHAGTCGGWTGAAAALLLFACFALKAGLVPVHGWLPGAHSVAPGNISALLSAVMLKCAVYGMLRLVFECCSVDYLWIAVLVLFVGLISAVYGIYLSLREVQIKRILACSSIENMGLIFSMLGAAMLFKALGQPFFAALAIVVALLHSLNHAIIKAVFFMSAATLMKIINCGNIEKMGGLMKRLPLLGTAMVLATAAISGVPLLNFFVSEFMIFKSLTLIHVAWTGLAGKAAACLAIALFGATIAAVGLSFVRLTGTVWLGTPRSEYGAVRSPSWLQIAPLLLLLAAALVCGLVPAFVARYLCIAAAVSMPGDWGARIVEDFAWYCNWSSTTVVVPLLLTMAVAGAIILCARLFRRAAHTATRAETWTCGIVPDHNMQYSATGIAQPIRRAFSRGLSAWIDSKCAGAVELLARASDRVRRVQSGNLHEYVGYILVAVIVLLVIVTLI